jgi:hypothetical protein
VTDISNRMFSLAPLCAPPPAPPLAFCLRLDGDKLAASQVAKLLEVWRSTQADDAFVRNLLSDAVVAFDRGVRIAGWKDVLAWQKKDRGVSFLIEPDRIEGRRDSVVVYGRMVTMDSGRFRSAASTQTWRREADGHYRLQSWTVEDFVATDIPL